MLLVNTIIVQYLRNNHVVKIRTFKVAIFFLFGLGGSMSTITALSSSASKDMLKFPPSGERNIKGEIICTLDTVIIMQRTTNN